MVKNILLEWCNDPAEQWNPEPCLDIGDMWLSFSWKFDAEEERSI
jgi:hypothetical protein